MVEIRSMSLAEHERFNLSQYPSTDGLLADLHKQCGYDKAFYPVNSNKRYYNVPEEVYRVAHAYVLWNGKYTPDEITPEMVREMDIPDSLKLLHWIDKFKAEESKKNL